MSAKGRGEARGGANDFYSTPEWCVRRLLDEIGPFHNSKIVLEPCAGNGAIIRAVNQWHRGRRDSCVPVWVAAELRAEEEANLRGSMTWEGDEVFCPYDSLAGDNLWPADFLITNPPYSLAQEFITKFLHVRRSFWLLRVNFLGSAKRHEWWRGLDRMPNVYVLPNRPCFALTEEKKNGKPTGRMVPGTDACEYAWFEFGEEACGDLRILDLTPDEEIEAHKQMLLAEYEKKKAREARQMELFNA